MDWQAIIDQFEKIEPDELTSLGSSAQREHIERLYNKALDHVHRDSADIAIISLRRLAADHPEFGRAPFLAACLLALNEQPEEAYELVSQAISATDLDATMLEQAQACQAELQKTLHIARQEEQQKKKASTSADSKAKPSALAGVLQRTRRRRRVKIASEKERQDVLKQGDAENQETFIENKRTSFDFVKIGGLILIILILVAALIFTGSRFIFNRGQTPDETMDSDERLEWLLSQLEEATDDDSVQQILNEYAALYGEEIDLQWPTESEETTVTPSLAPIETPEPTPEPTPVPTIDPAALSFEQAENEYQQALQQLDEDIMIAAEKLLGARDALRDVPEDYQDDESDRSAAQLREAIDDQIDAIARPAANAFRIEGRALFDAEEYEAALEPYLLGFELDPGNYGGGLAYYCGRSYQLLGEHEEAKPYFEYVVDEFSGRDIADYSANRLREMGY